MPRIWVAKVCAVGPRICHLARWREFCYAASRPQESSRICTRWHINRGMAWPTRLFLPVRIFNMCRSNHSTVLYLPDLQARIHYTCPNVVVSLLEPCTAIQSLALWSTFRSLVSAEPKVMRAIDFSTGHCMRLLYTERVSRVRNDDFSCMSYRD